MAESFSREKLRQARKKVDGKICVTFFLCDPGWYESVPFVASDQRFFVISIIDPPSGGSMRVA